MRVRIVDLDASVRGQPALARLIAENGAQLMDLRPQAAHLRIFARAKNMRRFVEEIRGAGEAPGHGAYLTFFGSGDFHHLTAGLVSLLTEPMTIIHFDNHPDWVNVPPTFNCGAWVNRALELPQVARVITLGVCSDDLHWPRWKGANLAAVAARRHIIYPWRAARAGEAQAQMTQAHVKQAQITQAQVAQNILWPSQMAQNTDGALSHRFMESLGKNILTSCIYVTIDKDVLVPNEAVTNWDQGRMRLTEVLEILSFLTQRFKILGADICGDYSRPRFRDPLRAALAYFDHPAVRAVGAAGHAINARTNAVLLETFRGLL